MIDLVRASLHRAITTKAGDGFLPVRLPKDLARRANAMLGEPICSLEEIARRRAGHAKLEALRSQPRQPKGSKAPSIGQAPVMVYFEKDRNQRMLGRIKEMLDAKGVRYTLLDVAGDEVARDFVLREARCKDEDLPVVFVANTPIGDYTALVDWDVSGRLGKALEGR